MKLGLTIIIVDLLLGTGAFTALTYSSAELSLKIFLGFTYANIAFLVESKTTEQMNTNEQYFQWLIAALLAVENRINGNPDSILQTLEQKNKESQLIASIGSLPYALVLMTMARFAFWLCAGWGITHFLLK